MVSLLHCLPLPQGLVFLRFKQLPFWLTALSELRYLDVTHEASLQTGAVPQDLSLCVPPCPPRVPPSPACASPSPLASPHYRDVTHEANLRTGAVPQDLSPCVPPSPPRARSRVCVPLFPRRPSCHSDVTHEANLRTGAVPQDLSRLSHLEFLSVPPPLMCHSVRYGCMHASTGRVYVRQGVMMVAFSFCPLPHPPALPPLTTHPRAHRPPYSMAKGNGLVGFLPESWGSLTNLTMLSLEYNQLVGSIPRQFSSLRSLKTLHCECYRLC
ncbi:unnamed protein product [Closterium sp. NIES-64]|nr:unnamed protein product [Closterium sp. NIES-64]